MRLVGLRMWNFNRVALSSGYILLFGCWGCMALIGEFGL